MIIRCLRESELELLFYYSKLEAWFLEKIETESLFQAYPQDFFIAFKGQEKIGFIIAIKHSKKLGFISSFLVVKKFRSQGYGKKIFLHAIKHLEPAQIALDSLFGEERFYEQFAFKTYFEVCIYRYALDKSALNLLSFTAFQTQNTRLIDEQSEYLKILLSHKDVFSASISSNHKENAYLFSYKDGYKIEIQTGDIHKVLSLYIALTKDIKDGTHIYIKADVLSPLILSLTKILNMQIDHKYNRMYNKII